MDVKPGIYQHYKGNLYEVIGVGRDSDTLEPVVLYKGMYIHDTFGRNPLWSRSLENFLSPAKVDGKKVTRYRFVRETS